MEKTNFYKLSTEDVFVRSEKAMTLREYFELGKELTPGTLITLNNTPGTDGGRTQFESFYIGDCTPYMQPTENDGGVGWNMDDPRFDMFVSEVFLPSHKSRPRI